MPYENNSQTPEKPDWQIVTDTFLRVAPEVHKENARGILRHLCLRFIWDGDIDSFAAMQTYLRKSSATTQLVAMPFKPAEGSALHCIDMQTLRPRGYWLDVAIGDSERAAKLGKSGMSADVNEAVLTDMTGTLVEMMPADFAHPTLPGSFSAYEMPAQQPAPRAKVITLGATTTVCSSLIRIVA